MKKDKSYVYLLKSEKSNSYKIGVSKNPEKRIKHIQTGNDGKLIIIKKFPSEDPYTLETTLHNYLGANKEIGEWFNLPIEFEDEFILECEKIEKNIGFLKDANNIFI